jgi:DNA-dependent RNA polymerase auxiliary subunit epsilon
LTTPKFGNLKSATTTTSTLINVAHSCFSDFLIVLFKDKRKRKIINKFKTLKKAKEHFQKLISENEKIVFGKEVENGHPCNYEIALLSKNSESDLSYYIKDNFGRQVRINLEDEDFTIKEIKKFKVPDKILDYQTRKKIDVSEFISKYLNKKEMNMVSKLNNKIIVQHDTNYYLFTFKTVEDSSRFIDNLSDKFISEGRIDCLFVKDSSSAQKKYLYELLESVGYPRQYLFRHSTTYPIKT